VEVQPELWRNPLFSCIPEQQNRRDEPMKAYKPRSATWTSLTSRSHMNSSIRNYPCHSHKNPFVESAVLTPRFKAQGRISRLQDDTATRIAFLIIQPIELGLPVFTTPIARELTLL
jgi:hypothetical protein